MATYNMFKDMYPQKFENNEAPEYVYYVRSGYSRT